MLLVTSILGRVDETRFALRRVERLQMTSADASKRRLRGRTDAGSDVAIDLPRGTYVEDGAVLVDDGERIVVVVRKPEDGAVHSSRAFARARRARPTSGAVGHAFGNQHVPIEVADGEFGCRSRRAVKSQPRRWSASSWKAPRSRSRSFLSAGIPRCSARGICTDRIGTGIRTDVDSGVPLSLRLGDSALPTGRFAHSYGLEELVMREPDLGPALLELPRRCFLRLWRGSTELP